jgi:hypothetical protein
VGGPITKDNTAVEYYDTIFTIDESPITKGLIWVGSDDGLIHLTRDGGKNWSNVTPKDFPAFIRVNCIAASPFDPATAYVAATMYLTNDDFSPFLYKTTDYGKTWTKIVSGIPADDFTRTIRPDPNSKGLLFAGTEAHLYISYNDGDSWKPFQLNLPNVPITDIAFHKREDEMVVATQGRGFYVLGDLPLVRALAPGAAPQGDQHLFAPKDAYRYSGGGGFQTPPDAGANPPSGVVVYYSLKTKPAGDITLRFLDANGKLVKEFSSKETPKPAAGAEEVEDRRPPAKLLAKAGMNRFVWDMRYTDATRFPGMIFWGGGVRGPLVVPGKYTIELVANGKTETQAFTIKKDPRSPTTPEDFNKQLEFELQILDRLSAANQAVIDIRKARQKLDSYATDGSPDVAAAAKRISASLTSVEEAIYQTKLRANEDALNFPIRLNNKLAALLSTVSDTDVSPTAQSYQVFTELNAQLRTQLDKLDAIEHQDIDGFNKLVRDKNIPAIVFTSAKQ